MLLNNNNKSACKYLKKSNKSHNIIDFELYLIIKQSLKTQ